MRAKLYKQAKILRAKYFILYFALCFCVYTAFFAFGLGCLFLVLRHLNAWHRAYKPIILLGLCAPCVIAAVKAFYHRLPNKKAVSLIDCFNKAGGLILSAEETGDYTYLSSFNNISLPKMRANLRGKIISLLSALIFLCASLLVPAPQAMYKQTFKINPIRQQNLLEAQIKTLKECNQISSNEAFKLNGVLEEIIKNSDANNPAATFEALERLSEGLKFEAENKAKSLLNQQEAYKNIVNASNELKSASAKEASDCVNKLNRLIKTLAQGDGALGAKNAQAEKRLKELTNNGINDNNAAKAAAEQIKNYINQRQNEIAQMAEKLKDSRLINKELFNGLNGESEFNGKNGFNGESGSEAKQAPGGENRLIEAKSLFNSLNAAPKGDNGMKVLLPQKKAGSGGDTGNGEGESEGSEVGESISDTGGGKSSNVNNGSGNGNSEGEGSDVGESISDTGGGKSSNGNNGSGSGGESSNGNNGGGNGDSEGEGRSDKGESISDTGGGKSGIGRSLGSGGGVAFGSIQEQINHSAEKTGQDNEHWFTAKPPQTTLEHSLKLHDEPLTQLPSALPQESVFIGMAPAAPLPSQNAAHINTKVNWQAFKADSAAKNIILPRHKNAVKNYFGHGVK